MVYIRYYPLDIWFYLAPFAVSYREYASGVSPGRPGMKVKMEREVQGNCEERKRGELAKLPDLGNSARRNTPLQARAVCWLLQSEAPAHVRNRCWLAVRPAITGKFARKQRC
jgi:hypothetical protein